MNVSKLLALVACVCFAVGFVLVAVVHGDAKLATDLLYLGLAFLAGAHAV